MGTSLAAIPLEVDNGRPALLRPGRTNEVVEVRLYESLQKIEDALDTLATSRQAYEALSGVEGLRRANEAYELSIAARQHLLYIAFRCLRALGLILIKEFGPVRWQVAHERVRPIPGKTVKDALVLARYSITEIKEAIDSGARRRDGVTSHKGVLEALPQRTGPRYIPHARKRGDGHVYEVRDARGRARYRARVQVTVDGRSRKISSRTFATAAEAEAALPGLRATIPVTERPLEKRVKIAEAAIARVRALLDSGEGPFAKRDIEAALLP